jgi:L-fuconolactonase
VSDFPIVDAHLHLWEPGRLRYPWLASVPLLNKPFLLSDYNRGCGDVKVGKMVFIQCEADPSQFLDEAEWVTSLARQDNRIGAIVPWAPLEKGSAAQPDLEKLAANELVKGIRRIIQFEPDPNFCLRPDFVRGVQLLAKFKFSFDICIKGPQQTANATQLVRQCPDVKFIIDHIGKPFIKGRQLEPWKSQLRQLALIPNVWCKMSGLVVEADLTRWTPADLTPYIDHVLDCFGPGRVMFGGDWPVILQASQIPRWAAVLQEALVALTLDERNHLFHDNAMRFYRLN